MVKIESAQNETFKKYLSLTSSRGLKKEGLFLLSGEKLIREFLKTPAISIVHELIAPGERPSTQSPVLQFSSELFAQIDVLGTHFNILVLEQPQIETIDASQLASYVPQEIEVVMPIGDPGNLGALLRSCEAFGVKRVLLTQEATHPFLPKSVKASAGSVLRLSITYGPALSSFPENSLALDMEGIPLPDFNWPKTGLLIVGEEGAGLGKDDATGDKKFKQRIRIPMQNVESLNVVVAASIALAHRAMAQKS